DETPLRGVMALPPAHCMTVGRDNLRIWQYFDIDPSNKLKFRDDREYADGFLEVFTKALTARMRANGIIGTDLSGGIDSSSIASLARKLLNDGPVNGVDRIEAFYLNFPDPESDERRYVKEVVGKWGLPLHVAEPTLAALPDCTAEVRQHFHLPSYPNGAMARGLMCEAAALGIRAHLGGSGGDEWLSGSSRYLADALRGMHLRSFIRRWRYDARYSPGPSLTDELRRAIVPLLPRGFRRAIHRMRGDNPAATLLDPGFLKRSGLSERIEKHRQRYPGLSLSDADFHSGFADAWMLHTFEMEERMASSVAIEPRYPFHDRRVIEFAARLPEEQRFGDRRPKEVLRNAMLGILPESVRNRLDKGEFSHVFIKTFARYGGDFFESMEICRAGWVRPREPARMFREALDFHRRGERAFLEHIWPLAFIAAVEIWFKVVILGSERDRFASQELCA
ncbi:MAG: asparagine synthase, partial [Candidatus Binataceae bacterium]|nr:asparagine synthase [Candidatus Binataceae bacterium]